MANKNNIIINILNNFYQKYIIAGNFAILLFVLVIAIIKFTANLILFYTNNIGSNIFMVSNMFSVFILVAGLSIFEYKKVKIDLKNIPLLDFENQKQEFITDYLLIFIEILIIISARFLTYQLNLAQNLTYYNTANISSIVLTDMFFAITTFVSVAVIFFVYKWLIIRQFRHTRLCMIIIQVIAVLMFLSAFFYEFYDTETLFYLAKPGVYILLVLLVIFANKNFNWIATFPFKKKWLILFISLFSTLACCFSIFAIVTRLEANEYIFSPVFAIFFIFVAIIFAAYSLKFFLVTLLAFPTSRIIDQKTNEIKSISRINDIVIKSINSEFHILIKDFFINIEEATNAAGGWCEIYEKDEPDGRQVVFCSSLALSEIESAHRLNWLKPLFMKLSEPVVIESVSKHPFFKYLKDFIPSINSMGIIPITYGSDRVATILLFNKKEYEFGAENLTIMKALFDIFNVAYDNTRLLKESIEIENELLLGKKMQQQLLPQNVPNITGYTIAAHAIAALEVGGDYYDFVTLADGRHCVLIADVSGKGLTAALVMAYIKGIVTGIAHRTTSPKELLTLINSSLTGKLDKRIYITMTALRIDDEHGNVTFARAGHTPVLVKTGKRTQYIAPKGIGLALINGDCQTMLFKDCIEEMSIKLGTGDCCVLFTDGINEARDMHGNEFGFDALKHAVENKRSILNADEAIYLIINDINKHAGSLELHDDMTVLVLFYNGL